MINHDYVTKENINDCNQNWLRIPDCSCIGRDSGSRNIYALLNLIKQQDVSYGINDKIYLYVEIIPCQYYELI